MQATAVELCDAGLLTCTHGEPGDEAATYALAWEPLDHAEQFSAEVRAKHAANMTKLTDKKKRRHERAKAENRGY
ncbi:MAG: hypothetical protein L0I62_01950 [Gammaproteobacteria bacterium]|nr:hypothetical protein [Gammaproteobacteria bacterium]